MFDCVLKAPLALNLNEVTAKKVSVFGVILV